MAAGVQRQLPKRRSGLTTAVTRPGLGQDFMPNGPTDDPEIPRASSAVDYIARRLALDWLPYSDRAVLGIFTMAERTAIPATGGPGLPARRPSAPS